MRTQIINAVLTATTLAIVALCCLAFIAVAAGDPLPGGLLRILGI